ncbi:efflux RND transporter periplasmic adaptor subunit [Candidatus Parcubacteria bacterium]|nr:efflux RND transporter periplasmic adaptor subunit [Candidatus Parcubacteria bacterium]
MAKKIILIVSIIALVLGFLVYQFFLKEEGPEYSLVTVIRGDIVQEISETGTVKRGEEINLGFKTSGRIEKIYVKVGDMVKSGGFLAKLGASQLTIQLTEAKASLNLAEAKLNQLLAGFSQEEIKITETAVANAQTAVEDAEQNLTDTKAEAEENLNQSYEDALNILNDAYLKIYNAYNTANSIQETYFSGGNQESTLVKENKNVIENARNQTQSYLNIAKNNPIQENIDIALRETKNALNNTYNAITIIRNTTETPVYENSVSSADKSSLDTEKSYINTALTNLINSQQTISSAKLTNESNINTAQAALSTAKGALEKAQNELALKKADPRPADIDLYQAQVKQAQASVSLLENQIQDCVLKSPVQGQITKISQKAGEMAKNTVISLIPAAPFQIEVDIYEEDIVKMSIGNPADIFFIAFPDKIFNGKIISIDPAEKLIEGVVYYRVIIDLEEIPEKIKPGMTTDLVIKTAFKENVLIIPEEAIQKKDDKIMIEVLENNNIKEREVKTGLLGSDDMIEIISGLKAGEKVILPN